VAPPTPLAHHEKHPASIGLFPFLLPFKKPYASGVLVVEPAVPLPPVPWQVQKKYYSCFFPFFSLSESSSSIFLLATTCPLFAVKNSHKEKKIGIILIFVFSLFLFLQAHPCTSSLSFEKIHILKVTSIKMFFS
jgi:hypothetical protein